MNNIINSSTEFTPPANESFVPACRRDHPLANKQLVEWQELLNYKPTGVRSSSGNRLLTEQHLADKPRRLNWLYEIRHLPTSLGLVEAGLGVSTLSGLAVPQTLHPTLIGILPVEPVIRRMLGAIRRRDAIPSPLAEHFLSLLLNLWADDKGSLWTSVVECRKNLPLVK